ncbi:MAG: CDP-archaeol synthase [Proteobacteria bacterium]|nr:CDP-archaeol synthase [Pseudomonadota bacterium]MBU1649941.1 CDP-archaeol synthase [Pseudomonadota bacterium]MBU1986685.1 CDP-archaeol synthase [Pseudomonadota bacterium]
MIVAATIVLYLLWINALPPLVSMFCGDRWNRPLDGGRVWRDQQPLFGPHKTIRGILASLLGGSIVAPLIGVAWWIGALASLLAMSGDLLSSFIKRRRTLKSGTEIVILDQLFESLFPALFLGQVLDLSWEQIAAIQILFITIAYWSSRFWHFIIYRPPLENYPRQVRSTVRLREWRACHTPLARWQALFNLTSVLSDLVFLTPLFKLTGLNEKGRTNALKIEVVKKTFCFPSLPDSFDQFRILLLTDLHLDGLDGLTDTLINHLQDIEVDLCLIGGDIRMQTYGPIAPCLRHLRRLLPHVRTQHGLLGVLGNHDCLEMAPDFEECGLIMLINESWPIERNGERIWIVGVDDPHFYKMADAEQAFRDVPAQAFSIFLAHSPETYKEAAQCNANLYLCGHTHGGQICLPGNIIQGPLLTNSRAPRFTASGNWQYQQMKGYTSRGAGSSSIPLRFNCPGEITLITLVKGEFKSPKIPLSE